MVGETERKDGRVMKDSEIDLWSLTKEELNILSDKYGLPPGYRGSKRNTIEHLTAAIQNSETLDIIAEMAGRGD